MAERMIFDDKGGFEHWITQQVNSHKYRGATRESIAKEILAGIWRWETEGDAHEWVELVTAARALLPTEEEYEVEAEVTVVSRGKVPVKAESADEVASNLPVDLTTRGDFAKAGGKLEEIRNVKVIITNVRDA